MGITLDSTSHNQLSLRGRASALLFVTALLQVAFRSQNSNSSASSTNVPALRTGIPISRV